MLLDANYGCHRKWQSRFLGGLHEPNLGLLGSQKGPKEAFWAETWPYGGPGRHNKALYQVKVCGKDEYSPVGPPGGNCDQILLY